MSGFISKAAFWLASTTASITTLCIDCSYTQYKQTCGIKQAQVYMQIHMHTLVYKNLHTFMHTVQFHNCRTFSPVMFGALYSLSLSDTSEEIGFPVDFHLIFILFCLVYLLSLIIVAFFPKRLEKQRKSTVV